MLKLARTGVRWAALMVALLALTACGFHLRGSQGEFAALPPVFVRGGDPAALELSQMLRTAGTTVAASTAEAELIVVIGDARRERRVLSVGTRGRVQEYQLIYQLDWHGENRAGRHVIAAQTISQSRNFSFDETDIIAKSNEEDFLFRDMQRNAVMQIMRRLQVSDLTGLGDASGESPQSASEAAP
jgi:LPS-assembly lipoprotein